MASGNLEAFNTPALAAETKAVIARRRNQELSPLAESRFARVHHGDQITRQIPPFQSAQNPTGGSRRQKAGNGQGREHRNGKVEIGSADFLGNRGDFDDADKADEHQTDRGEETFHPFRRRKIEVRPLETRRVESEGKNHDGDEKNDQQTFGRNRPSTRRRNWRCPTASMKINATLSGAIPGNKKPAKKPAPTNAKEILRIRTNHTPKPPMAPQMRTETPVQKKNKPRRYEASPWKAPKCKTWAEPSAKPPREKASQTDSPVKA